MVCVSHNDAVAFCQWLTTQEKSAGRTYRLPTEAEWEYACRAGTEALFLISEDPEDLIKIANVADASAKEKFPDWNCVKGNDGFVYTAPVGSFAPNAWGLYDMIGNAWEWCADGYDEKYYASSPTADPPGASEASHRVYPGRWLVRLSPGTAARRTATGTRRSTGTATWASAWPQSRNELGTEPRSGGRTGGEAEPTPGRAGVERRSGAGAMAPGRVGSSHVATIRLNSHALHDGSAVRSMSPANLIVLEREAIANPLVEAARSASLSEPKA